MIQERLLAISLEGSVEPGISRYRGGTPKRVTPQWACEDGVIELEVVGLLLYGRSLGGVGLS